ncbi:hypothetical protein GCM10007879_29640 [Maritalea porphyrae]|uniref:Uncharacterized protein n=1 Tax=Maritalea porphyrae TaxID=880732 RepID=A0ABQ5UVG9_9HYPH|nr:hypothetical protein GCM10007879_29640 [Maritalea porphyrae]
MNLDPGTVARNQCGWANCQNTEVEGVAYSLLTINMLSKPVGIVNMRNWYVFLQIREISANPSIWKMRITA